MPVLRTPRLLLRPFTVDDAPRLANHRSDPDIARHCPWTPPYPVSRARSLIADSPWTGERTPGAGNVIAIELTESNDVIGDCAYILEASNDPPPLQASIGFTLSTVCGVDNTASWRLMERIGMRREAHHVENIHFKGAWESEYSYAILAREWRAAQARTKDS